MKTCWIVLFVVTVTVMGTDDAPSAALLQSVEERFSLESAKADALVAKAEVEAAKVRKSAAEVRLKAYKDRLVEVTKTGDFDKATAVKARIEQLEKEPESAVEKPAKRQIPKDAVRFNGHSYALITEPATWHVAKRRCEELGGHLVCINSSKEEQFVADLCGKRSAWVGATDEDAEGKWWNVDGSKPVVLKVALNNADGHEHWLNWNGEKFNDFHAGARMDYVCEWER